jgi:hypothetical protein
LGEKSQALEEALLFSRIIAETNQICHYVLPAYSALFEVYSGSLAESTEPERQSLIKKNLNAIRKSLWEFGIMYPIGRVQYGLHEGQYHMQAGRSRRAVRTWRKALKLSIKFRMPFCEGLIRWELARALQETEPQKAEHLRKVRELFQATHAEYYLNRLNASKASPA